MTAQPLIALLLAIGCAVPLCAAAATAAETASAGTAANSKAVPRTLLQRLRQLIGYNPRLAVGGSRRGSEAAVCLISPALQRRTDGSLLALVASPAPVLVAASELNELRIERGGSIVWQQRASSREAIRGPIAWPLQPLAAGEELQLRLRPRGASGGDFATIVLKAAPPQRQQQAAAFLQRPDRLAQIERLLAQGQGALAAELVFAPMPPAAAPSAAPAAPPALEQLRRELIAQGCSALRP